MFKKIVSFFSKLISKVNFRPTFSELRIKEMKSLVRPGDILLCKKNLEFSNIFIPGKYKHAAFLIREHTVIEARSVGVVLSDVNRIFYNYQSIKIVRPVFQERLGEIRESYGEYLDSLYDWSFEEKDDSFYCSELIYEMFADVDDRYNELPRNHIDKALVPSDFENENYFKSIYEGRA